MRVSEKLSAVSRRRWVFLAFLVVLHLVLFIGPDNTLGRLLFLSHFGLGLLWQPFVQPRRKLQPGSLVLVVTSVGLFAYLLNWWLILVWLLLLSGVVGGKVFLFPDRWERLFHLSALVYLAGVMLAWVMPETLADQGRADSLGLEKVMPYLLPWTFGFMALLPAGSDQIERAEVVDFVYGILIFLLMAVIALGSVTLSLLLPASYPNALMVTLGITAATLLLLGLIWNPSAGFGGLGQAMAQHVISLGLPIEDWIQSLAALAKVETDPERFLIQACAELPRRLPGIIGGSWKSGQKQYVFGQSQGYSVEFHFGELQLELKSIIEPSPSLLWHYDLVARLLAEFHLGKLQAQQLQQLSYIEAIHATGARLTHDVKNLLQSLETLCIAARQESENPSSRFTALVQRQLPEIAARLRQTLMKLSVPRPAVTSQPVPACDWFAALRSRFDEPWIAYSFEEIPSAVASVDGELFSSVAENLLQNIFEKRRTESDIGAQVSLGHAEGGIWLEVADNGSPIPAAIAEELFQGPANSENGLGIGLYQSERLAEQRGHRLELVENRAGLVRFRLGPAGQLSG